jgi:hypothetical protein
MPTRYGPAVLCSLVLAGLVYMSVRADDQRISSVTAKTAEMQATLDRIEATARETHEAVQFLRQHEETLVDLTR